MILAGDVGGTKTLIGLFSPHERRPAPVDVRSFPTTDYDGLPAIIEAYLGGRETLPALSAAAFGVAGPVVDGSAQMTNVPWRVDVAELRQALTLTSVHLLNDLEATAYAVPVLAGTELRTLQQGSPRAEGNMAVVAAGTGLGGALLQHVGNGYVPVPSEIGHSDFAARTDRELDFVRYARARFGRVEIEHVVCGPGLLNLADFTHGDRPCAAHTAAQAENEPAKISEAALERTCPDCTAALEMFVEAYGAVAGNLALIGVTTAGVFIGGGIAPRILPALEDGRLVAAFNAKPPMDPLLTAMPVHVILNDEAALLGAAVRAALGA